VNNYLKALRFTLFWLKENVPNPNEKGVLSKVHEELYEELKEEYDLPSKVAEDRYKEALATYKGCIIILRRVDLQEYTSQQFG
jgi:hypothetical protein